MEQQQVEHRCHPHGHAHIGAVVEHVEAEIHKEDLHRDHHAVKHARQDAGLEIALECLAVGRPPVTGLITQGAQNGIVHTGQRRARQNAARSGTDQHHGEAVHQKADVDQADDREKAQAGEQVCKEHAAHIAAHQLEETAYAGLAGGVFLHARPRFEIICRGE